MDREISIPMPLDSDGFLRRGCPICGREFKWLHTDNEVDEAEISDRGFCCPYCGAWAQPDQWFTEAQVELIQQVGLGAAVEEVEQIFSRLDRQGSSVTYTPGDPPPPPGELPPEPDDMRRVDFDCHPKEPLQVAEDWADPIHCLICGTTA